MEESIVECNAEPQQKEIPNMIPTCVVTRCRSKKHAEESEVQKDMEVEPAYSLEGTFMDQVVDEVNARTVKLVMVMGQKRNLIANQKNRVSAERDLHRNK